MSDLIEKINQEALDVFYISEKMHLPDAPEIKRCYRTDFTLIPKHEIKGLCKKQTHLTLPSEYEQYDFFVYNERKKQILPFKKNDYLMDKDGYTTFDGETYYYYDSDGNELGKF